MNAWIRDDLPSMKRRVDRTDFVLDAVVDHLNAHHPKPNGDCSQSEAQEWAEVVRKLRRERDAAIARAEQAENARDTVATRAGQLEKALAAVERDLDDPAVHVVRESDIAAVKAVKGVDGREWIAGNYSWLTGVESHELRRGIPDTLGLIAAKEAIARAIEAEQVVDPVEEKARSEADRRYSGKPSHAFIEGAVWAARHLNEQESGDE